MTWALVAVGALAVVILHGIYLTLRSIDRSLKGFWAEYARRYLGGHNPH